MKKIGVFLLLFASLLWGSRSWYVDFMNLENPEWALPKTSLSRVVVSNGHFYNFEGRVKFWGVNITGDNNYPLKVDAPKIARSLRLLGVNMVRLHFMEFSWGKSLLLSPDSEELDPGALDRLDYFVSCLKNEGIYVDMNLHVGRVFSEIPEKDRNVFELGKIVGYIDDKLVDSQKRYATRLLTHTNSYTGLPYTTDPVVAIIEVNNENALTGVDMDDLARLSSYYQDIMRRYWNAYLVRKYTNYAQWKRINWRDKQKFFVLAQTNAWQKNHWRWEAHQGAVSSFEWDGNILRWKVEKPGKEKWHNQFMCERLELSRGSQYEVVFEARSKQALPLEIHLMQNYAPWGGLGWYTQLTLTTDWKTYRFSFIAEDDETNARVNLSTALNRTGEIELRNFVMQEKAYQEPGEEAWQKRNMPLPWEGYSGGDVKSDFRQWMIEREKEVVKQLRSHLRSLGCQQPITHTQVTYGALAGLLREGTLSDFIDTHAYWQHPEFPSQAWSPTDWRIGNTSQLWNPLLGPLSYIAFYRVDGKPFTVSEYNVPAPNSYATEAPVWLALWGAFQDWDGVYLYTLLDFGGKYYQKHMTGFFHIIGNGAQMALLPWAARIYKHGMVWDKRDVRLVNAQDLEKSYAARGAWYDMRDRVHWTNESLFARVGVTFAGKESRVEPSSMPWQWNRTKPYLFWTNDQAFLITGNTRGLAFTNGNMVVSFDGNSSWGTVAFCTLDSNDWQKTKRILGVFVGAGENTDMKWNATRTSVGSHWGRPPYLLTMPTLRVKILGFRGYELDERGQRTRELQEKNGEFLISESVSPWIVFERRDEEKK